MKKRLITLVSIGVLAVSLVGCAKQPDTSTAQNTNSDLSEVFDQLKSLTDTENQSKSNDAEKLDNSKENKTKKDKSGSGAKEIDLDTLKDDKTAEDSTASTGSTTESKSDETEIKTATMMCEELKALYKDETPELYLFDKGDTYEEYQVIYDKASYLDRMLDVCFFDKDYVTEDDIYGIDIESIYPGFLDMEFTEAYLDENDDYYIMILIWNDLTNEDNVEELVKSGQIELENGLKRAKIDAKSYCKLMEDSGSLHLDPKTGKPM